MGRWVHQGQEEGIGGREGGSRGAKRGGGGEGVEAGLCDHLAGTTVRHPRRKGQAGATTSKGDGVGSAHLRPRTHAHARGRVPWRDQGAGLQLQPGRRACARQNPNRPWPSRDPPGLTMDGRRRRGGPRSPFGPCQFFEEFLSVRPNLHGGPGANVFWHGGGGRSRIAWGSAHTRHAPSATRG